MTFSFFSVPNFTIKSVNNGLANPLNGNAVPDMIDQTIASIALDTTRKVEILTNDLQQSDEEIDKRIPPVMTPVISQPHANGGVEDNVAPSLSLSASEKKIFHKNGHTDDSVEQTSSTLSDLTDETDGVPTNPDGCVVSSMLHSIQLDGKKD